MWKMEAKMVLGGIGADLLITKLEKSVSNGLQDISPDERITRNPQCIHGKFIELLFIEFIENFQASDRPKAPTEDEKKIFLCRKHYCYHLMSFMISRKIFLTVTLLFVHCNQKDEAKHQ